MFTLSKDNGEFNSHPHSIKDDFWLVVKSLKIVPNEYVYRDRWIVEIKTLLIRDIC